MSRNNKMAASATDPRMKPAQLAISEAYNQMSAAIERLIRSGRIVDSEQLLAAHETLLLAATQMQRNARIVVDLINADRRR